MPGALANAHRTMFSHWRAVQHAAISRLGALTLLATIAALLYTSAATALVQPQLKFSLTKTRELQCECHEKQRHQLHC